MVLTPAVLPVAVSGISILLALGFATSTLILSRRCARLSRHAARVARRRVAATRLRRVTFLSETDRYWSQVRNASAPILITSPDGGVLAASTALVEMFGYRSEEDLRQLPMEALYVNAADRSRYVSALLREHGHIRSCEFRMRHRDGHQINVLTTVRVIVAADGASYYEGILTDISELRAAFEQRQQLEAQLHLARKLELVGRLASGIAHEINTPMQYIGDNISFLKRAFERLFAQVRMDGPGARPEARPQLLTPEKLRELVADVAEALDGSREGVDRVSETVRAMKEFAHPGDLEMASTDLNQALRTTLVVARNEYKDAAEVQLELGDIPPVDCRRAEINKVFLNLIVNAAHAIEGSGKRGVITIRSSSDAAFVRIEIADDGCGIPAAVLPRIFEPFFTTKAVGKGTGQGLAIARTVVKGHGGELSVASIVGQGTTFTIRLPIAAGAARTAAPGLDLAGSIG